MHSLKVDNYQEKINIPELEHAVLDFWDETKAFEQSVESRPADKRYVFYDGPPFATGLPHYGHILASTIKDVIPRYWTMKGYRVDRVWGWDCHGIPIENIIEKELKLKGGKKGIEAMGIDKFNAACRAAILRFDKEWEKVIRRIGRWVDFKHSYKTMDLTYMESVWWAFKQLVDKSLVYEGRKVILYCPRCATPLSNFEIAMDNSYKEIEDNSVYVMFKVSGKKNEYFLAWTTTPWTLIGNVALAVDKNATYVNVQYDDVQVWLAESLAKTVLKPTHGKLNILKTVKGSELVGISYEPLYPYMSTEGKKAHYVTDADFVSLEDGTGIVHTAAIFGEDDYKLAQKVNLPCVPTLDDQGKFFDYVTPIKGVFYKDAEGWIIEDLEKRDLMFRAEKTVHSYPFCYRCETPLYYNAVPAWFIDIQKFKKDLVKENEHIHWYPSYLKHGRFGKGLETAPDWNISRSRYWGTPMPVWRAADNKTYRIIGSLEDLKTWAVDPQKIANIIDIHREFLDDVEVWVDDKKTVKGKRIPEVFDCWVESGSMPYASIHYPFENKEKFEKSHPAQFIAEYIAQTRAWFYTLHVMSVGLFGGHTFENAVTTGTILAEDGSKMSKSKKNFPDPQLLFEKYGVDALRFYLMGSVVMKAENVNFSEMQVKEIYQKIISTLWNVFSFYQIYVGKPPSLTTPQATHVLDTWIISRTASVVAGVTNAMDGYDTVVACRLIEEFVSEFSTWYLRRSRERIRKDATAQAVFGWVLYQLALIISPIVPFISELLFQNLTNKGQSIHLELWPHADGSVINSQIEEEMNVARKIVELAHASRKEQSLKVRQPLASLQYTRANPLSKGVESVIAEEVNVKEVRFVKAGEKEKDVAVILDTKITPALKEEGEMRELIHSIQMLRKQKGCTIDAQIFVELPSVHKTLPKEFLDNIQKETLVKTITWGKTLTILTG
jgi:isoleucyl-tRNA synthetase